MHRAGWAGTHPSYSVAGLCGLVDIHLGYLVLETHPRQQHVHPLLNRKGPIQPRTSHAPHSRSVCTRRAGPEESCDRCDRTQARDGQTQANYRGAKNGSRGCLGFGSRKSVRRTVIRCRS